MSRERPREFSKYDNERDNESINCCQLEVHKELIRERKALKSEYTDINIFGKRSCTDILCLFVFIAAVIGWIAISVIVFYNGGPRKILSPTDSLNRRCGYDKDVKDRPYLFHFDISKCLAPHLHPFICDTKQVCLAECPKSNFSSGHYLQSGLPLSSLKEKLICVDEFDKNYQINNIVDVENAIRGGYCAEWYMESKPMVNICIPRYLHRKFTPGGFATLTLPEGVIAPIDVTTEMIQLGIEELKKGESFILRVGEDLVKTWPWIVAFLVLSMVVSFIYIILMRWLSGILVWMSLVALLCLLSFSSFYTWKNYSETKTQEGVVVENSKLLKFAEYRVNLKSLQDDLLKHEYTWLALFILSSVSLVIIAIVLLFLRRRIMLAIQLIKEGSKAVSYAWSSLLFPPFPWTVQLIIFIQGALIFCYLLGEKVDIYRVTGLNISDCKCSNYYKDGDICDIETFKNHCRRPNGDPCLTAKCNFSENEALHFTIYLHLFNLLMFLWCEYFVAGFSQMSLAMTFATYYWTAAKRKLPFCIVGSSIAKVIRYHLGTIAFGSLLMAILNWLRILVEVAYRYMNKNDNVVIRCLRCCCGCLLACLHRILRILTKNAYIMCAMKGSNYCISAKDAFNLIIKNILRAAVLDGVTGFLFFLMKLVITISMGVAAYFFFSKPIPDIRQIGNEVYHFDYYFVPIIAVCLGSFLVASLFFSVYSTAVDTIFLCALEDLDRNDGSQRRPYVMSKSLIKIFKVRNRTS